MAAHRLPPPGAGRTVRDDGHVIALEKAVLAAFTDAGRCRHKTRRPPSADARAEAAPAAWSAYPAGALLAICRRLVDANAQPVAVHQGHNGTVVLRAATATGEVIVKLHRGADRHRQGVHAYRHWTPALRGRAPRLLASTESPPAIITTALRGCAFAEVDLDAQREVKAHQQAVSCYVDSMLLRRAGWSRT